MAADSPLRVALVGYGLAGRVLHRPLLEACPDLEVTHVVTGDPERRAQAAVELPAARVLPSSDALWACADAFDVVVVAAANLAHVPVATAALELGRPTVVDKPLAPTAAEAAALCELAAARGVPLTVFHNRRWDSDTLTAAALLRDGVLGEVHRLESRFTRFRPQVQARWREDAAAGGGVLLDLGSHLVDQAVLLLGPVTHVYAEVDRVRPYVDGGGGADDDVLLALTHAGGARSSLWASMAAPWPGPRLVLQGSAGGWAKQSLDATEEAMRTGAWPGPVAEPDGRLWTAAGEVPVPSLPGDWPAFYAGFAAAARGRGPVPVDPRDGVRTLQVLEAARRSAERREVVALG